MFEPERIELKGFRKRHQVMSFKDEFCQGVIAGIAICLLILSTAMRRQN